MSKKPDYILKAEKALDRARATDQEQKIYLFMVRNSQGKTYRPFRNAEIAQATNLFRTTVLYHLNKMIEKGLLKREGRFDYLPLISK